MTMELVAAVKAFALDNWGINGWDVVWETMDEDEIAEAIEGCTTEAEAIKTMGQMAALWQENENEQRAAWDENFSYTSEPPLIK